MSDSSLAEIYFIAAMMILILFMSGIAVFFFVRTYKKEKAEHLKEKEKKLNEKKAKNEKEYAEK